MVKVQDMSGEVHTGVSVASIARRLYGSRVSTVQVTNRKTGRVYFEITSPNLAYVADLYPYNG